MGSEKKVEMVMKRNQSVILDLTLVSIQLHQVDYQTMQAIP